MLLKCPCTVCLKYILEALNYLLKCFEDRTIIEMQFRCINYNFKTKTDEITGT